MRRSYSRSQTLLFASLPCNESRIGGYAKTNIHLHQFVSGFNKLNTFSIEQTYTGKSLFAMNDFVKNKKIIDKRMLFIHTGGLAHKTV